MGVPQVPLVESDTLGRGGQRGCRHVVPPDYEPRSRETSPTGSPPDLGPNGRGTGKPVRLRRRPSAQLAKRATVRAPTSFLGPPLAEADPRGQTFPARAVSPEASPELMLCTPEVRDTIF